MALFQMQAAGVDGVRLVPRGVGSVATLFLNNTAVGSVTVTGWDTSWGFGRFRPEHAFASFAPAFELWSALIHDGTRLDRSTAADLVVVENAIDRIRAKLYFAADDVWVSVVQLNIDGELLEWKEY